MVAGPKHPLVVGEELHLLNRPTDQLIVGEQLDDQVPGDGVVEGGEFEQVGANVEGVELGLVVDFDGWERLGVEVQEFLCARNVGPDPEYQLVTGLFP